MESGDSANASGLDSGHGQYGGYIVNSSDGNYKSEDLDDSLGAGGGESDGNSTDGGNSMHKYQALREQDRFLPIANVARIMKVSIPKSGKIAKDAKECVQECVSEFVSFITSEASDRCHQEKRKTINGEDILFAMSSLGFDNYVGPLKLYLNKYREAQKGEKGNTSSSNPNDESSLNNESFGESLSFSFNPSGQGVSS